MNSEKIHLYYVDKYKEYRAILWVKNFLIIAYFVKKFIDKIII